MSHDKAICDSWRISIPSFYPNFTSSLIFYLQLDEHLVAKKSQFFLRAIHLDLLNKTVHIEINQLIFEGRCEKLTSYIVLLMCYLASEVLSISISTLIIIYRVDSQ